MYKSNAHIIIGLIILMLVASCRKEELVAGKGGNASLVITPQHHGVSIANSTVYIKYNAKNTPTYYDDSVQTIMQNGIPVATFTQLSKGDYYLYGTGFDTTVKQIVKGGIPFTISNETVQTVYLPVTE